MLRRLKTEKYIALISPPSSGIDYLEKIILDLGKYCIFNNLPQIEDLGLSVTQGIIPSINGYLKLSRLYDERDLSVSAEFIYVEGTSKKDLDLIRRIIKKAGLEEFTES